MQKIITNSEKQTFNFAKKYAKQLKGNEIVGLTGELGAGKTIFIKGLAAGLGIKKTITSPTFVLMKVYPIKSNVKCQMSNVKCLVHIDAYRIKSAQDIIAIGVEDYFKRQDTIAAIEWADRIKKILPKKTKYININSINMNRREIIIKK